MNLCGIDEAGRGSVLGPMVIAGIVMEEVDIDNIYVKDSKLLSPKKREQIASSLATGRAGMIKYVEIEAVTIDEERKIKTLNDIELEAFTSLITDTELDADIYYVDSVDVSSERFESMLKCRTGKRIVASHHAESRYKIVAAASIMAKVRRDERMKELNSRFDADAGSGYPADKRTIEFIRNYLRENNELPPETRKSWETVERILKESRACSKIT